MSFNQSHTGNLFINRLFSFKSPSYLSLDSLMEKVNLPVTTFGRSSSPSPVLDIEQPFVELNAAISQDWSDFVTNFNIAELN